jgi:hypothetical protein
MSGYTVGQQQDIQRAMSLLQDMAGSLIKITDATDSLERIAVALEAQNESAPPATGPILERAVAALEILSRTSRQSEQPKRRDPEDARTIKAAITTGQWDAWNRGYQAGRVSGAGGPVSTNPHNQ